MHPFQHYTNNDLQRVEVGWPLGIKSCDTVFKFVFPYTYSSDTSGAILIQKSESKAGSDSISVIGISQYENNRIGISESVWVDLESVGDLTKVESELEYRLSGIGNYYSI